jgi:hypothetical protein
MRYTIDVNMKVAPSAKMIAPDMAIEGLSCRYNWKTDIKGFSKECDDFKSPDKVPHSAMD